MSYDFIFCPLCGGSKWLTDKTRSNIDGKLIQHKCADCKEFIYINHTTAFEHPVLVGLTKTVRYSIQVRIYDYIIVVNYHDNTTVFESYDSGDLILKLNVAVAFNWYKNEDLIEKIKKYIVFS